MTNFMKILKAGQFLKQFKSSFTLYTECEMITDSSFYFLNLGSLLNVSNISSKGSKVIMSVKHLEKIKNDF